MTPKQKPSDEKKWAKPNVKPEVGRALKKIALDNEMYVYELIEDMARKEYPGYFREKEGLTV